MLIACANKYQLFVKKTKKHNGTHAKLKNTTFKDNLRSDGGIVKGNGQGQTIADHQKHEGLVSQQPQYRRRVGVAFRRNVPGLSLCLGGRNCWFFLKHW